MIDDLETKLRALYKHTQEAARMVNEPTLAASWLSRLAARLWIQGGQAPQSFELMALSQAQAAASTKGRYDAQIGPKRPLCELCDALMDRVHDMWLCPQLHLPVHHPALHPNEAEPIHMWFELSYSNYLVYPRSILQSMPREWQQRFVSCLIEAENAAAGLPDVPQNYNVTPRGQAGRFQKDPYSNYDRGRRKVELKAVGSS